MLVTPFTFLCPAMAGRKRRGFLHGSVHGDDALDPALGQQLRVAAQECLIVAMHNGQEEVVALAQILLEAADDG